MSEGNDDDVFVDEDGNVFKDFRLLIFGVWDYEDQIYRLYNFGKTYGMASVNGIHRVINRITGRILRRGGQIDMSSADLTVTPVLPFGRKPQGTFQSASLSLLVYVGPPPLEPNGTGGLRAYTCDHIDKNHDNDDPTNLRWSSKSEQTTNRKSFSRRARWIPTAKPSLLEYHRFVYKRKNTNYYISKSGNVVKWGPISRGPSRWLTLVCIKQCKTTGRVSVNICGSNFLRSRLVAYTWPDETLDSILLDDIDDKSIVVRHFPDPNPTNDHRSNLKTGTMADNSRDMHEQGRGNDVPVNAYLDGNIVGTYSSIKDAENVLGVYGANISKVLNGKRGHAGGYTFERVNG